MGLRTSRRRVMRRNLAVAGSIILAFAVGVACAQQGRAGAGPAPQSAQQAPPGGKIWRESTPQSPPQAALPSTTSLAPLIKQLKPAVVNISTTTVMKNPHRGLRRAP